MDKEATYAHIANLIATIPDFPSDGQSLTNESLQWLGRVHAICEKESSKNDVQLVENLTRNLNRASRARDGAASSLLAILYRALASAELQVSPSTQGSFIPAASVFDALAILSKILSEAKSGLMIVDPYMDEKALTNFCVLCPVSLPIRLLTDSHSMKPGLIPAVSTWKNQYSTSRPLEAKKAAARSLHDRVIIIDQTDAWVLTQSLNAFAARAPASVVKADRETSNLKVQAYNSIWSSATVL